MASYIDKFFEDNRKKMVSRDEAAELARSPLYYSAIKLADGAVDGFVGGAANSTSLTVRALLKCVGVARIDAGSGLLSSFFLMLRGERFFLFADCAIMPDPDSAQIAEITIQTAASCRAFTGNEPKIALLSFSTHGSAKSSSVSKVRRAAEILKERKPDFEFTGEIQADAAIVPDIAFSKTKGQWSGGANVLIFPNLDSGNIAYKLVERLAGYSAIGPVIQGLRKPGNDLSRGCSKFDIINVTAMTAVQCSMAEAR